MNWQKTTSGAKQVVGYIGNAEGLPAAEGLQELWKLMVSDVVPLNAAVEWDFIKLEIWPDSGRLIAFPASSQSRFRVEMAVCQVFFPSLLQAYEEIDDEIDDGDEDEEADRQFSEAVSALVKEWAGKTETAARTALRTGYGWKVKFYSSEGEEPLHEFTLG